MFAVIKVAGDTQTILGKFDTCSEAMAAGETIFQSTNERIMLALIEANFDENDQIIGIYKFYHLWR